MNEFQHFLDTLAKVLQFSQLRPDRSGACLIDMKKEEQLLLFEYDDQLVPKTVLLSQPLLALPLANREKILELCLQANATIDETISYFPSEDYIYFHRRIHPEISVEELDKTIKSFMKNTALLKEKIEDESKKIPAITPFPPPPLL